VSVQPEPIALAGSGAVAQTLGRLLIDSGANVVAIASRRRSHAEAAAARLGHSVRVETYERLPEVASHIIVAVTDGALRDTAHLLATALIPPAVVVHTCGAQGPDVLMELRGRGAACGVVHPLQTIPDPDSGARTIRGATFAIGGDETAIEWAAGIVRRIGCVPMLLTEEGFPLYHAGAVLAGNGAFALVETALSLLAAAGVERSRALDALAPLCRRSLDNALTVGPAALTGPMARGSAETIRAHLMAIRSRVPEAEPLYRSTGTALTELAREHGLGEAAARDLMDALSS
jgi:predicted short-subunit dehydrogenase-like oxidoreductase (DUF2520 family)